MVTDRRSNLLYVNAYAAKLFERPRRPRARSSASPCSRSGSKKRTWARLADLAKQVLHGRAWDGTFASVRPGGFRRADPGLGGAAAAPVRRDRRDRHRRARRRPGQRWRSGTGSGCWSASGSGWAGRWNWASPCGTWPRRWSRSSPTTASSTCSRATSCSAASRSTPAAGNRRRAPGLPWASRSATRRGISASRPWPARRPVVVSDLATKRFPAPSADSMRASEDVGLVSIVAAPLVRPGRAARRDEPGAVRAHRAGGVPLRPRRPGLVRRGRQPGRDRDRQRDAVRGGAAYRAGVPEEPAAPGPAHLRRPGRGLAVRAGRSRWRPTARASRPRSAATGTTSSRWPRGGSASSSATWKDGAPGPPRSWASSGPRCGPSPRTRRPPRTSCASWTTGAGRMSAPRRGGRGSSTRPRVSCTYFVYDPWSRELSFANAGHDAPLLVVDGEAPQLDIERQRRAARRPRQGHQRAAHL